MAIATEQEKRVDEAAPQADVVITDTTALMVAIYSAMLFEDGSLYRFALARQRTYDLTLVTGLDLAWVADGLQREGPHVREPVDALVRESLAKAGVPYKVVYGQGVQRLESALAAMQALSEGTAAVAAVPTDVRERKPWAWSCEKCSDPACEHRLFTGLA